MWSFVQRNRSFDFCKIKKPANPEFLKRRKRLKRRNAKAALTRVGKSLRYLIESKRTGQEVRDFLSKVQEAYEALVVKHEEFTQLIEDDNEFEEQEAWLAES